MLCSAIENYMTIVRASAEAGDGPGSVAKASAEVGVKSTFQEGLLQAGKT